MRSKEEIQAAHELLTKTINSAQCGKSIVRNDLTPFTAVLSWVLDPESPNRFNEVIEMCERVWEP